MFTTCIYCAKDLEKNDVLETFPVGRRLAFDAANGRLWVVCRSCQRWNLSPLEERWEAIESAEKRFRDSRMRVSTDNIGMAKLREGLELIRIGEPQRPEMAAWRYGDQFGRRRKRQLLMTGTVVGGAALVVGGGIAAGVSFGAFGGFIANNGLWDALIHGRSTTVVGRIAMHDGRLLTVQRTHARMSKLVKAREGSIELHLEHSTGTERLYDAEAMRVASQLLPAVNRFGGSKKEITSAVDYLEDAGGAQAALQRVQHASGSSDSSIASRNRYDRIRLEKKEGALHTLPVRERLVLEMALHEEQERRAMLGELHELARMWREADEIARIADTLFEPKAIADQLQRLKNRE